MARHLRHHGCAATGGELKATTKFYDVDGKLVDPRKRADLSSAFQLLDESGKPLGTFPAKPSPVEPALEANIGLPNFAQHVRWVTALTAELQRPALEWQTPFGLPSPTCGGSNEHWRDNRVHYFFGHVDDLVNAGVAGMTFGTGAGGQTNLGTDDHASFAALFTPHYGPDGAGSTGNYTLGVKAAGVNSGLVDTLTGHNIFLYVNGSGNVVGKVGSSTTVANSNGAVAFTISVTRKSAKPISMIALR